MLFNVPERFVDWLPVMATPPMVGIVLGGFLGAIFNRPVEFIALGAAAGTVADGLIVNAAVKFFSEN